ncbi:MAG: CBS domain-containing protein [Bacillota bacterium]
MTNSDRFLNSFSEIEDYLEKYNNLRRHDSFGNLVNKASKSNSIIRQYQTDLFELKDLRNAIVHERSDGHIIAEPHESTVELIEKIEQLLKNPPGVLPTFKGKVATLTINDSLLEAVRLMEKKSYTQIPILDEELNYRNLLTTNIVVRWLGSNDNIGLTHLSQISLAEVLKYKEDNNICLFIPGDSTFYDVLGIFERYKNKKKKLESLIITRNGTANEKFLGIITNWDLPVIYDKIEYQS